MDDWMSACIHDLWRGIEYESLLVMVTNGAGFLLDALRRRFLEKRHAYSRCNILQHDFRMLQHLVAYLAPGHDTRSFGESRRNGF